MMTDKVQPCGSIGAGGIRCTAPLGHGGPHMALTGELQKRRVDKLTVARAHTNATRARELLRDLHAPGLSDADKVRAVEYAFACAARDEVTACADVVSDVARRYAQLAEQKPQRFEWQHKREAANECAFAVRSRKGT